MAYADDVIWMSSSEAEFYNETWAGFWRSWLVFDWTKREGTNKYGVVSIIPNDECLDVGSGCS